MGRVAVAVVAASLVLGASAGAHDLRHPADLVAASESSSCTRGRVEAVVREFVRAYNEGDSAALERIWAQEPDFQWYFVHGEREGPEAHDRSRLGTYFFERHVLGDRLRLGRLRVGPPNDAGHFGIAFRLRRSSTDRSAEGSWHGKASATTVAGLPPLPYSGGREASCMLAVWGMGRD